MSLVFYDTETTGVSTAFDQILQFAAIRTDSNLNELERFEVRCRLDRHIVPSPGALRVTGLTIGQLLDPALPSHYEMMRGIDEQLSSWSPSTFVGYNSIQFDEHLVRHAFYRTLHPLYRTNSNGNSRSDVLRMVQAVSLFAPGLLELPVGDKGHAVFKLDQVAPANGFDHSNAHDALADVEATIFLSRLIAERTPEIWSAFMRFSQKAAVIDYVSNEPIFCLADFYYGRPYSWLVTMLGVNATAGTEYFVYDLGVEPESLLTLTDDKLVARLARSPKPVRSLKVNASPIMAPADSAPAGTSGADLDSVELERRVELLRSDSSFRARLVKAVQLAKSERVLSVHVEEQIYDGFASQADQKLLVKFHSASWEDRTTIVTTLADARLRELGTRLIHHERPDVLPPNVRSALDKAMAQRVVSAAEQVPWLTIPKALSELAPMIETATGDERGRLEKCHSYLVEREAAANELAE